MARKHFRLGEQQQSENQDGEDFARVTERPRLRRSLFAWGMIDQVLASGTTFAFSAIAARNLGPSGLGTVTIGYAAFLIALGLHRSLIVDPLLTRMASSTRSAVEALRAAISATLTGGLLVSLLALTIGLTTMSVGSRGMLIFAPWIAPALIHALLRAWLYRSGRGVVATITSGVWLVVMLVAVTAGLRSADWQITAAWGLGACAALAVAAVCTAGAGLAAPRAASGWYRHEAFAIGTWRTLSGIVFSAATYARVAGTSSILGPAAVGGYRAVETAFAPASLISPAVGNPGLPMMRERVEHGEAGIWAFAVRLSLVSTVLALAYIVPVTLAKNLVLEFFGSDFSDYAYLIPPIVCGQVVAAIGTGFSILLVAARKVQEVAILIVFNSVLTLALALPLAAFYGLEASAWGIVVAAIPPLILLVVFSRRVVLQSVVTHDERADDHVGARRTFNE